MPCPEYIVGSKGESRETNQKTVVIVPWMEAIAVEVGVEKVSDSSHHLPEYSGYILKAESKATS